MVHYSIEPKDQIFVEGYTYFSFAKFMSKNIGKDISKYIRSKYSQKLLDQKITEANSPQNSLETVTNVTVAENY